MEGDNQSLPQLDPLLKLYPSDTNAAGEPEWTLYHPTSNQYFKISWAEFEILSRFHTANGRDGLLKRVNLETSVNVDDDDIVNLLMFLSENGLLATSQQMIGSEKEKSLYQKMMHGYLYFTIPLIRPDRFLTQTLPYVRPLLGRNFLGMMVIVFCVSLIMTLPRAEEFFNSFTMIFSAEGLILSGFVLFMIKVVHEFAHGYMAKMYGVPIPHMGVAFIVLYPVFYTEVTGAWRLSDRMSRMKIGLAGVQFEFYLATMALILWNFMMPGVGQMICFTIIMISLVGSLLINLNPLMRFDGYYVLSDYSGIENLHAVAIDYARAFIRKTCLGWNDDVSHDYAHHVQLRLTIFGLVIMLYRLSLFLGIAVLVYHVFMKPLGLFAMVFELAWFIGLPIWKEIKIWLENFEKFKGKMRFKSFIALLVLCLCVLILPWRGSIQVPGVMQAREYQSVFAPVPAKINNINVVQGQSVHVGDVLVTLSSLFLDAEIKKTEVKLQGLVLQKRREQTNVDLYRSRETSIDVDIATLSKTLDGLKAKADNLIIRAQLDGQVIDVNNLLSEGQSIGVGDLVMRVITPNEFRVTAYIGEQDVDHIQVGNRAIFRSSQSLWGGVSATIVSYRNVNSDVLEHEILSSFNGGGVPTQQEDGKMKPINSIYEVVMEIDKNQDIENYPYIRGGTVIIKSEVQTLLMEWMKEAFHIARRELSFN